MERFVTDVEFEARIDVPKGDELAETEVYVRAVVYLDDDGSGADILEVSDEDGNDLTEYAVENYGDTLESAAISEAKDEIIDYESSHPKWRYMY